MWIFLWVVLSSILLGATFWSLQILMRQKNAWEAYAKAKKLTFKRGTFMGPPEMYGMVGDYKVSFFTAERAGPDIRTRRYVTVVEVELYEGAVDGGVFGTKEMNPFMESLSKLHRYKVDYAGWDETNAAFVRNDEAMAAYLTSDKLEAIANILKTRNADVLVVLNEKEIVFRLETVDPMQNADKIDKIISRLLGLGDKLRIDAGQREALARLIPKEA